MIDLVKNNLEAIAELCWQFNVTKLDLFGSAATGEFVAGKSDVDFIYDFDPMEDRSSLHQYFDLKWALEELLGVEVDLVSEPSGRNPIFLRSVNRSRVEIYRAGTRREAIA